MPLVELFKSGWWTVSSKTDPRWNGKGCTDCCGGFQIPKEAQDYIDRKKLELGDMPEDLEWSYMKD